MPRVATLLLGEALVDLVCERPVASLSEAREFRAHFGGALANVAVNAARAGADVALAGGAGDDAWGGWLRDRLAEEGVDVEWFALLPGVVTPIAFVTVDTRGEPTFAIYGETIGATIEAFADRIPAAVERSDALVLMSNTLVGEAERAVSRAARDRALELGRPVIFDPNFRLHRWDPPARAATESRDFVRDAFLVKCNRDEARLLTGEADPAAAAEGLLAMGAQNVVVTLGADGALARGAGGRRDEPGVPARLAASAFYAPSLPAALPDAVAAGARATESWGALA
jgi:fructokinase